MSRVFFLLLPFMLMSLPLRAEEPQNPYDLLQSLDPATPAVEESTAEDRVPASVEPGQIAVQKKLPDAKLNKTERTLQWEFLKNKGQDPAAEMNQDGAGD
jgi:hypothetical protein